MLQNQGRYVDPRGADVGGQIKDHSLRHLHFRSNLMNESGRAVTHTTIFRQRSTQRFGTMDMVAGPDMPVVAALV